MANFLDSVKVKKPNYNTFDLSHDLKLSGNMGNLIPILCMECVPGDNVTIGCESLIRFAPLVAPMMHRVNVTMHYFFVPYRLLWDNWKNFITKTEVSGSVPAFPFVQYDGTGYGTFPLLDYLGLPEPTVGNIQYVNAMPLSAYQLIFNEYYRDENLVAEVPCKLGDGDNGSNYSNLMTMRRRAWEKDYFTAALPFAQKGDSVEIPITGEVTNVLGHTPVIVDSTTGAGIPNATLKTLNPTAFLDANTGTPNSAQIDPNGSLEVANAETTINDLRRAYALQRFLEKMARGGSRLTEWIRVMFGVKSSDARLQRPEYITGTVTPVTISEVLNTTGTVDAPQGAMAGHGVSVGSGKYGRFFCEEHGLIMGIMSVLPRTAYQQGIPKLFLKINDATEYFTPDFANIGEQEIMNKEVYVNHSQPDGTFGYIPRYGEYKYMQNRVAGDFKSSLNYWHMGRIFTSEPNLNEAFVTSNPTHRVFADTDEADDKLWCHVYNHVIARRLMPKFGTPTF